MKCECQNWAREASNSIEEHHPDCPNRAAVVLTSRFSKVRDAVIAEIIEKYHDWEVIAGQDAQVEQDPEAFDYTMHALLAKALEPLRMP
jgi:hypothetical protein